MTPKVQLQTTCLLLLQLCVTACAQSSQNGTATSPQTALRPRIEMSSSAQAHPIPTPLFPLASGISIPGINWPKNPNAEIINRSPIPFKASLPENCSQAVHQAFQRISSRAIYPESWSEAYASAYKTVALGFKEQRSLSAGEVRLYRFPPQTDLQTILYERTFTSPGPHIQFLDRVPNPNSLNNCREYDLYAFKKSWNNKTNPENYYLILEGPGEYSLEFQPGNLSKQLSADFEKQAAAQVARWGLNKSLPDSVLSQAPLMVVQEGHFELPPERIYTYGYVYSDQQKPLERVSIKIQDLYPDIEYFAETFTDQDGFFIFHEVPAGLALKFTASKPGFASRQQTHVLISNKSFPGMNRHDFGIGQTGNKNYGHPLHALSNKPEVVEVSPGEDSQDITTRTPVMLGFSIPMNQNSVEKNFQITALESKLTGQRAWDQNDFKIEWNQDSTQVIFKFKPQHQLKSAVDSSLKYRVSLDRKNGRIRSLSGFEREKAPFKLAEGPFEEIYTFSVQASPRP